MRASCYRCSRCTAGAGPRRVLVLAILLDLVGAADAEERPPEDEVTARLRFLEKRLEAEAPQARAWHLGCSLVDITGLGYGAILASRSSSRAQLGEGVVGAVTSLGGLVSLGVAPFHAAEGARELDGLPDGTPDERERRLLLAESLLRRNAGEAELRYQWKPHVFTMLINVAGGALIAALGNWQGGLQSAGIGIAVGEVQIWTAPWKARRDLQAYRMKFDGLASARTRPVASVPRASVRAGLTGLQVTF